MKKQKRHTLDEIGQLGDSHNFGDPTRSTDSKCGLFQQRESPRSIGFLVKLEPPRSWPRSCESSLFGWLLDINNEPTVGPTKIRLGAVTAWSAHQLSTMLLTHCLLPFFCHHPPPPSLSPSSHNPTTTIKSKETWLLLLIGQLLFFFGLDFSRLSQATV